MNEYKEDREQKKIRNKEDREQRRNVPRKHETDFLSWMARNALPT